MNDSNDDPQTPIGSPLTGAADESVVLVADGGVALIDRFLSWRNHPAIVDASRMDPHPPRWLVPPAPSARRVAIINESVSTGLLQQRVAHMIRRQAPDVNITFGCVRVETRLGALRQHWRVTGTRLVPADWNLAALPHRYLLALVGFPGCGKSFLRRILGADSQVAVLRWGAWAEAHARRLLGADARGLRAMQAFYQRVERPAPAMLALTALKSLDPDVSHTPLIVVDGIKNRDQLRTLAYGTGRPPIIVAVVRDEAERRRMIVQRGHPDDDNDAERTEFLRRMGLDDLVAIADLTIDSTGCTLEWDRHRWSWVQITTTDRFRAGIVDLWRMLGWDLAVPVADMLAWRCAAAMISGRREVRGTVLDSHGHVLAVQHAAHKPATEALLWETAPHGAAS